MARIIYSPVVTEIAGSIGGMTFQKNASGAIARLKPKKAKTNTQKQRDQQPKTKLLQQYWQNLTLAQKIEWNTFAGNHNKIGLNGQEKKLTGYQWFLTINQNRVLGERNILLSPPTYEVVNPINGISVGWNQSLGYLEYDGSWGTNEFDQFIYSSFVINSASLFNFSECRLVNKFLGLSNGYNVFIYNNTTQGWGKYFNTLFPPILGNKNFYLMVYIRLVSVTSGISSLAYTAIAHFVWDGTKYVIEEF